MKLQSTADRDPGEARKERAREDPQNYIKEQDIPTEEQFMHESVSKDLKSIWWFQQRFKKKGVPSLAEGKVVGCCIEEEVLFWVFLCTKRQKREGVLGSLLGHPYPISAL